MEKNKRNALADVLNKPVWTLKSALKFYLQFHSNIRRD